MLPAKSLLSILITSIYISGGIITSGLMQNVMFMSVTVISDLINSVLMPVIIISVILSAVGNMSDKMNIGNLIKLLRSFVKWCLGFLMIFFVGMFGIYGVTGSSIDACVGKTARFVIGSSVPVVGGVISDSLSTILATVKVVRNITGNIGMISVVLIAIIPIIKTTVYVWSLKLCAGVLQPVADNKLVNFVNDVTESVTLILICVISVTLLFILSVSVMLLTANMF